MRIILIYFLLFTFFIDQVLGPVGLSHMLKGLSLFNLNLYLLLIVWLLAIVQRRKIFMPNNINNLLILMGLVVLMSIFVKILRGEIPNISIMNEILSFKAWLNPVLLFFILFNIIDDENTCNQILLGLGVLFLSLILNQLFALSGFTSYRAQMIAKMGRIGGFSAAGVYAVSLVLFFPLVLSGSFFMKRSNLLKIGCIMLVFLFLVGLVSAGSRNGIVSFLCSMLVYLFILKRKKIIGLLPIVFLTVMMIVASATAFFASPSGVKEIVVNRFVPTTNKDLDEYSSGRIVLWKYGLILFIENPIMGHGRNSFFKLIQLRRFPVYGTPHNEYLRHLIEYGIIGVLVFCMIFLKIFQNIWQALERTTDPWRKQVYLSYLAGLCGFMAGIFFTNIGPAMYIFWIYTAVIYKYTQLDLDKEEISADKMEVVATSSRLQ